VIFAGEGLFLVELALLVYCVLSIITTPEQECRNLPKLLWLLLVVVLPLAGGIAWLVAGRPARSRLAAPSDRTIPPEYDRPGRAAAPNPDDDAAFLAQLKARAAEQRRQAAEHERQLREQEEPPTGT
jgi:hypothetical protein